MALADFATGPQKMGRSLLLKKPVSMVKMQFVMDSEGGEKFAHGDKRHLKKKKASKIRNKIQLKLTEAAVTHFFHCLGPSSVPNTGAWILLLP